jgi:hypothetical protein
VVVTAGHNVHAVKDFTPEERVGTQLVVTGEGVKNQSYRSLLISPQIHVPPLNENIVFDIALLRPSSHISVDCVVAPVSEYEPIKLETDTLMAGCSEETPFPFDFDKTIRRKVEPKNRESFDDFLLHYYSLITS